MRIRLAMVSTLRTQVMWCSYVGTEEVEGLRRWLICVLNGIWQDTVGRAMRRFWIGMARKRVSSQGGVLRSWV